VAGPCSSFIQARPFGGSCSPPWPYGVLGVFSMGNTARATPIN